MSSQPVPYPLRMPEDLRDRLTERARKHGRSLNAEIIGMLQDALGNAEQTQTEDDIDTLADAIASRVVEKLRTK